MGNMWPEQKHLTTSCLPSWIFLQKQELVTAHRDLWTHYYCMFVVHMNHLTCTNMWAALCSDTSYSGTKSATFPSERWWSGSIKYTQIKYKYLKRVPTCTLVNVCPVSVSILQIVCFSWFPGSTETHRATETGSLSFFISQQEKKLRRQNKNNFWQQRVHSSFSVCERVSWNWSSSLSSPSWRITLLRLLWPTTFHLLTIDYPHIDIWSWQWRQEPQSTTKRSNRSNM